MNEHLLISALKDNPTPVSDVLISDTSHFLSLLDALAQSHLEEAVPEEMMSVFSDEQWPQLLFELQPGSTVFQSEYNIVAFHQNWMKSGELNLPKFGSPLYWLVSIDNEGVFIRKLNIAEYQALEMVINGSDFSSIGSALWPELAAEKQQQKMKEMLKVWLDEGLVIDVGVPIPLDAKFE